MIGAQNSITVASVAESTLTIFGQSPRLVGTGQIGSELSVDFAFTEGVEPISITYQWYIADTVLPGENGDRLLVTAAMDMKLLKCGVTANISDTLYTTGTEPVRALYPAPNGSPDLPPEVLDANSGIQEIEIAGMVSGDDLTFSTFGAVGVNIDALTGTISIDTARPEGTLDLQVSASNSGGIWQANFTVTLEGQPAPNQVLDLTASNTALFMDTHGFPEGAIDSAGIWISGFIFYSGSSGTNPRLGGLADPSQGSRYIEVRASSMAVRNGGATFSLNAFSALSVPGWYLVTARVWEDGSRNTKYALLQNALVSADETFNGTISITNWTRLGLAMLPDSTPRYDGVQAAGFAWGTGDPTAYHTAIFDGGQFADPASYDFALDPRAALLGYEEGARVGDDNALKLDELSENWASSGSPKWLDLPPPYAGGEFGSLTALNAGQAASSDTFEIVTELPFASWDNPTVDLSKVALWATKGYGSLSATGASVVSNGGSATVTLDLSRPVFADEEIEAELIEAWVTDDAGNRSSGVTAAPVPNLSGIPAPSNVPGLSYGRVAFDFASAYEAGITQDGVMWVRDPGTGVDIAAKSPAQATSSNNAVMHGTMRNPQSRDDNFQGYTSVGSEANDRFDLALAVSFPVSLSSGDSLIGTVTNPLPSISGGGRSGNPVNILQYQGLIVTNFAPTQSDVAPPLVGYDAATRPPWVSVDVPAVVTALPTGYDTTGFDKPVADIVIARIERFHPALLQFDQVEMKREMTPAGFTNADGYGANFIATTSAALLLLLDDSSTTQERARLVRWIVHHYRQWYGVGRLSGDGGHNQGALGFLVLGDYWVTGGANIPTMLADMGGNEATAFQITDQATLERITLPHDGTLNWPRFSRRSTVSSVSGNNITVARLDQLSGSSLRDATRELSNLIAVRESDNAQSAVVGYDDDTGVLGLADNIPDFAVGDQVYFKAPWPQAVGDYEWSLRGLSSYSPSTDTSYRRLNTWSSEVMAIRALGLMHASMGAVQGYVEIANGANIPTGMNDFPDHHVTFNYADDEPASGAYQLDRNFWAAHWQTIKAVVQTV